jgi:hypothetical protein
MVRPILLPALCGALLAASAGAATAPAIPVANTVVVPRAGAARAPATVARAADAAFDAGDYEEAIRQYTVLREIAAGEERQRALEMLAVSRESNRQLAHAKALYEAYLHEYAATPGARRVQQRLAALVALGQPRSSASRQVTRRAPNDWVLSGYLAQFYERQSLDVGERSSVPIEGIFSDAGLDAMRDGAEVDQEFRIGMNILQDFSELERLEGREYQVTSLYWDGRSDALRSSLRLGRQSLARAGVLGRFDGAVASFRPSPGASIDVSGGYLIDYSFDGLDPDRPFLGVSGEWIARSGAISVAPFFVQQDFDGVLDRRAIGLQSRLQSETLALFTLVDYDLWYGELNNLTLSGDFQVRRSRATASWEHRKSPYLTTRNALIGQPYDDLSDLEQAIVDLQLEDIADDRTATSDTVRLSVNTALAPHWAVTVDAVASSFSRTESSADVMGIESYVAHYGSVQIRSTDLLGTGSYSALMLRQADSDASSTTSLYLDNRFAIGERWWLYPRVRFDRRVYDEDIASQWAARPSLRLDFRLGRHVRFEFEGGWFWSERDTMFGNLDITGAFVRAGYRASF